MFFAKLHPLIVHFPVGLLVSGALFEMYGKLTGEESSEDPDDPGAKIFLRFRHLGVDMGHFFRLA